MDTKLWTSLKFVVGSTRNEVLSPHSFVTVYGYILSDIHLK